MNYQDWIAKVRALANQHQVEGFVSDSLAFSVSFSQGKSPEAAFYAAYPQHSPGDKDSTGN